MKASGQLSYFHSFGVPQLPRLLVGEILSSVFDKVLV